MDDERLKQGVNIGSDYFVDNEMTGCEHVA